MTFSNVSLAPRPGFLSISLVTPSLPGDFLSLRPSRPSCNSAMANPVARCSSSALGLLCKLLNCRFTSAWRALGMATLLTLANFSTRTLAAFFPEHISLPCSTMTGDRLHFSSLRALARFQSLCPSLSRSRLSVFWIQLFLAELSFSLLYLAVASLNAMWAGRDFSVSARILAVSSSSARFWTSAVQYGL